MPPYRLILTRAWAQERSVYVVAGISGQKHPEVMAMVVFWNFSNLLWHAEKGQGSEFWSVHA